jgi:hypothetical protein
MRVEDYELRSNRWEWLAQEETDKHALRSKKSTARYIRTRDGGKWYQVCGHPVTSERLRAVSKTRNKELEAIYKTLQSNMKKNL